jgi:prevent-host-death family protein
MDEIPISKFKATCLEVLERVRKTGEPVLVTKFGKPVVRIVPPPESKRSKRWVGSMAGSAQILGDIVAPAVDERDWEVLKDTKKRQILARR